MPSRTLGILALITWLLAAGSGAYKVATWIARGGVRQQRTTGDRLAPRVVFGHFGLATTGLLVWAGFLATRWAVLAWLAVGLLMLVIGLGISTVTLWTPFPAHRGEAGAAPGCGTGGSAAALAAPAPEVLASDPSDEMLARALTDEVLLRKLIDDVIAGVRAGPSRGTRRPGRHLAPLVPAGHGVRKARMPAPCHWTQAGVYRGQGRTLISSGQAG